MRRSRFILASLLPLALAFVACDDDDDTGSTTPAVDASSNVTDTSVTQDQGIVSDDFGLNHDTGTHVDPDDGVPPALDAGLVPDAVIPDVDAEIPDVDAALPIEPVEACDEIPADDCFANIDCADADRCVNMGTDDWQVPCCMPGARGDRPAGAACDDGDGQRLCASSICVDGLCSDVCLGNADCPAGMQNCIPIAFSGNDNMWCMPE